MAVSAPKKYFNIPEKNKGPKSSPLPPPKPSNSFDVRAPYMESKAENKNNRIFEKEAQKTIGEKIKGLFAVVCAQTKGMMPDDDNRQDLASLWMQAAGVIAQVMNTSKVEENTTIQKSTYNLGLANLVGRTYESQSDRVKYVGENVHVRTEKAPEGSNGRFFEVRCEKSGQVVRKMLLNFDQSEVEWDGNNDGGQSVEHGNYGVRVINTDKDGNLLFQPTFVDRELDGLAYKDGMPYFTDDKKEIYEIKTWKKPKQQTFIKNV